MAEKIPDTIPQIGPATLAILRQYGIRTNLNVLYRNFPSGLRLRPFEESLEQPDALHQIIPGLGPGREALLREWAERVPLTAGEKKQLKVEHANEKAQRAKQEAEEEAHRAKKKAAEDAQKAITDAKKAKEDAQRAISENYARASRKREVIFGIAVAIGTIIGFLRLSIALMTETEFLPSIFISGFFSFMCGLLVFGIGSVVLGTIEFVFLYPRE
jgi:hypothetical protein